MKTNGTIATADRLMAEDEGQHAAAGRARGRVMLAHGGGGQLTDELLQTIVLPRIGNAELCRMLDSAILDVREAGRVALTIDGYVVQPWQFPGGDIGRIAMCGTINDLAVCGAEPVGIALGLIVTEGFPMGDLAAVLDSIHAIASEAGVNVLTGDTKVVGCGQGDGVYVTTAGVGICRGPALTVENVQPDDVLIVTGAVGDHGLAVMLAREMPEVQSVVRSDVAPLNHMLRKLMVDVPGVVWMRDPTRSGLAGVTADLAAQSGWHVALDEERIPVNVATRHAAEMLGLDPLEVANEGKAVIVVRPEAEERALALLRDEPYGRAAVTIGRVTAPRDGVCELHTAIGGRRILQKPYGEQLPRIC